MSLSRPVTFPIVKLPFLCIECVIRNWTIFDIVFFALTSQKTRRIVKRLKIPLNRIGIFLSDQKWIELGSLLRKWNFRNKTETESLSVVQHQYLGKYPLVFQKDAIPLYSSKTHRTLISYSDGQKHVALKMAMEFLTEVFKCSVDTVRIQDNNFPESGDIGVKSTVNLYINKNSSNPFGYVQSQKLSLLLENLEVTGTCTFCVKSTEKDFYVDPKLFKCKKLEFWSGSAAWVTREILLQFEVAHLVFSDCLFSVEDILAFVTNWLHSDNKKLEYLHILNQRTQFSLDDFRTTDFSWRNLPSTTGDVDIIEGLQIVRHDGFVANIYAKGKKFVFSVWNKQPAST